MQEAGLFQTSENLLLWYAQMTTTYTMTVYIYLGVLHSPKDSWNWAVIALTKELEL